jgi:pyrroloquinoline quinone biosynthesis protein E
MIGRPGLRRGVRLADDLVRGRPVLLYPEGVLFLNETAAAVVERCDTRRTADEIVADLSTGYTGVEGVHALLADLAARGVVTTGPTAIPAVRRPGGTPGVPPRMPAPLGLLAELTYRCPLQCTYCANPLNLGDYRDELDTSTWLRVFREAREAGVLQVHLSGGEPALRRDLVALVEGAHELGMYVNLITSGIGLSQARLATLRDSGLDHLQLSLQDAEAAPADAVAGRRAHDRKLAVAESVRALGLPLTVNAVLHRGNVGRLLGIAELGTRLGADRLELAHTQFYGWALRNQQALMPTREQVLQADQDAEVARRRFGNEVEIVYVRADYYSPRPKPCNYGWGARQLVVTPNGDTLPCLAAAQLPGIDVPSVRDQPVSAIWHESAAFTRFRGTDWLPEPCHGCALKEIDFGGCRCQAYQLTGDAAVTDPACELSDLHHLVTDRQPALRPPLAVPRRMA